MENQKKNFLESHALSLLFFSTAMKNSSKIREDVPSIIVIYVTIIKLV